MAVVKLDVRGLNHPEPLERSVAAFEKLGRGDVLHLVIHRYPVPLLKLAQSRGLACETAQKSEEEFHLFFAFDGALCRSARETAGV